MLSYPSGKLRFDKLILVVKKVLKLRNSFFLRLDRRKDGSNEDEDLLLLPLARSAVNSAALSFFRIDRFWCRFRFCFFSVARFKLGFELTNANVKRVLWRNGVSR